MSPDKGVAASRIGAVFFEGELKEPLGSLARPAARTIKLTYQCSLEYPRRTKIQYKLTEPKGKTIGEVKIYRNN